MTVMRKVNLAEALSGIQDHLKPRIAGELNGQHVKLVKLRGEFVWHAHEGADELFLVVRGALTMEYLERKGAIASILVEAGEFVIVPRGVRHRPVAREEVEVMLFEPAGTVNTGDALDSRRVAEPERI